MAMLINGKVGKAYNVGISWEISLRELVDNNLKLFLANDGYYDLHINHMPTRDVDIPYNMLANVKVVADTAACLCIKLASGLREALAWLQSNLGR